MAQKLAPLLATVSLVCLILAPSAVAASGIAGQRVVVASPPRAERAAVTSSLIASSTTCPDQSSLTATTDEQEQAMLCMTDFARTSAGLGELSEAVELDASAADKAEDVLRCDSFSHFACGREFTYWIRATGYIGDACWRAGENLAWGSGEYGSVRAIFRAWMSSPTHRKNILGDYDEVGIGLVSGSLEGNSGAQIWASHFGSRCPA